MITKICLDKLKTLDKQAALKLLYQWVKTGTISQTQFLLAIKEIHNVL